MRTSRTPRPGATQCWRAPSRRPSSERPRSGESGLGSWCARTSACRTRSPTSAPWPGNPPPPTSAW
eukprot:5329469-Lingulodinium_polyedra.AAC.1